MSKYRKKKKVSPGKKALKEVRKLKKLVRPEIKRDDLNLFILNPGLAGIVTNLTFIAQGNDEQTRSGIKINCLFFELRFSIRKHATPSDTLTRVLVVRDRRQEESVTPAVLDVLFSADPESTFTRVNAGRFQILYDTTIALDSAKQTMTYRTKRKKLNFVTGYIGAGAADITSNGIYMISISSENVNTPTMRCEFHLKFTDT